MITALEELIAGSDKLTVVKRAELRGKISTMPGLNRFLRVTPGGLLRADKAKAKAEENLDSLLDTELAPVIGDRNKLAHSQWKWRLNNKETSFFGPAPQPFNYLTIHRIGEVVTLIARMVNALVVSEPTFQRDYAAIYSEISAVKLKIAGKDYADFVKELRVRHRLGAKKRSLRQSNP